jgi:hypothetical protein
MNASRASIDAVLRERTLAVVGVSRQTQSFANSVYRTLKTRGYRVFPVNPFVNRLEGDPCYANVGALPERVGGAIVFLPRSRTEGVVQEIVDAGIKHVWLQQGTETPGSVELCQRRGVNVVSGECMLMFLDPVGGPHRLHRWIRKMTHRLPV